MKDLTQCEEPLMDKPWSVYIVKCKDNRLYTGISNNVERRIADHNKGRGCRFTKFRYPVELVYQENCGTKSAVRKRELAIQEFTRPQKLKLITEEKKITDYNRLKREEAISRKSDIFDMARLDIGSLSKQDLKLIGITLYWAEGYKTDHARDVEFVNSDPLMIKLIMKWFREICNVPESKFKIRIHIHDTSNLGEATKFWSSATRIPLSQFTKSYTKTSPSSKRKAGNKHPCGVCHIRVADTNLLAKIKGWVEGIRAL